MGLRVVLSPDLNVDVPLSIADPDCISCIGMSVVAASPRMLSLGMGAKPCREARVVDMEGTGAVVSSTRV